ncbi:MAG: diaminopimelate epimerase [Frankiales bacterium]|nr:diaminopimelate epimerase [Frankiales bacterium]
MSPMSTPDTQHSAPSGLDVLKGHGTGNDFVVIEDLNGALSLSASFVRALCDRHTGVGADGVLRIVRTAVATEPDVLAQADHAEFFMDYRNADGSIAEMCGNGARLFACQLHRRGLIGREAVIATRGGARSVSIGLDEVSVDMGPATVGDTHQVSLAGFAGSWRGVAVDVPNPHVVVELDDTDVLAELELVSSPVVEPRRPDGQNVEFVVRLGPAADQRLRMRVFERGVGETLSCGTGICAAVVALAGELTGSGEWIVEVPGGECRVSWTATGSIRLTGPAVIVGRVHLAESWLVEHR